MSRNHRPTLINKLADLMTRELKSLRASNSRIGDDFEQIKTITRHRLSEDERRDLCLFLASVVVDANGVCNVSAKRPSITAKTLGNKHPSHVIGKYR